MTAEETLAACGGAKKCGGEEPHFRYTICGLAVIWKEAVGQPYKAKTVEGKFERGEKARSMLRGEQT